MSTAVRSFYHPIVFWLGCLLVALGVAAHAPMFLMGAPMHFRLVGMPMDTSMLLGMGVIPLGLILVGYALTPPAVLSGTARERALNVHLSEGARLNRHHWALFAALLVAIVVDVMKPATLGFVIPGFKAEYQLDKPAILALFALTGTIVGSILWGRMGDIIGRRGAILLAAVMFMATSICGAMPSYEWNLVMCFLMGASAGGMLPITFTLLAEVVPPAQRGWLLVALGGLGTAIGYLVAAMSAWGLEPLYSWRSLWLLGLPTGAMVLIAHRFIPESPRFLSHVGAEEEARAALARFGVTVKGKTEGIDTQAKAPKVGLSALLSGPYGLTTLGLGLAGIGYGIVNFGFLLWLPTALTDLGLEKSTVSMLLALSGLLALPGMIVVIPLYQRWSTILTVAGSVAFMALGLAVYALTETYAPGTALGTVLSVALVLVSTSAVVATLLPYASEIYPIELRSTGTGVIAAATKVGGLIGALMGFFGVSAHLSSLGIVLILPLLAVAALLWWRGVETRGVKLEDVHARVMGGRAVAGR